MSDVLDVLDQAISSLETLRRVLGKGRSKQVSAQSERAIVKATAHAWIRQHRREFGNPSKLMQLQACDTGFSELLAFADRSTTRERYRSHLRDLKSKLATLRSEVIADPSMISPLASGSPDWSRLIADPQMQSILTRRWQETAQCLSVGANLAATVMMGAMLEALLLSRVNHLADKSVLFQLKSSPKDKSGKALPLQHWTLQHYIDVAHEMGWIRQAARDVSVVLRDYRNYIHPSKELSHGVRIEKEDAGMFWVVFQNLADQIANI